MSGASEVICRRTTGGLDVSLISSRANRRRAPEARGAVAQDERAVEGGDESHAHELELRLLGVDHEPEHDGEKIAVALSGNRSVKAPTIRRCHDGEMRGAGGVVIGR